MPTTWSMVDISFPTFKGDEKPREQIASLIDYMFILTEALKFQLDNLDASNWNATALTGFQVDTTADVEEQVQSIVSNISLLANELSALSNRMSGAEGRMNQAETDIAWLEKGQAEQSQTIQEQGEQINTLLADMDGIQSVMTPDGAGGATLGKEGATIHLVGNIYVNGKLLE